MNYIVAYYLRLRHLLQKRRSFRLGDTTSLYNLLDVVKSLVLEDKGFLRSSV